MGEEDAFWMMHAILRGPKFSLHGLYSPGFPTLHQCLLQLEYCQKQNFPKLTKHLKQNDVAPMLYAPQWFITLFAYNLPMELILRIWDILFYEGIKIVFKLSLFFFKKLEKDLLKTDFPGIVGCLKTVHESDLCKDPDFVIHETIKVKLSRGTLAKLAKKYQEQHLAAQMAVAAAPRRERR